MTLTPAGSFAWLARHELRLAFRARPTRGATRWIGYLLVAGWLAIGCGAGWMLRDTPIPIPPDARIGVLAVCALMLTFMTAQAMIGSQRTLYESGDLALLLSAPVQGRSVLRAKLLGIAATIALTYAVLLLPIVLPVAILGHPRLFGLVALLIALALVAASLGLALTLLIATLVGPRAARTVGQVVAAVMGAGCSSSRNCSRATKAARARSARCSPGCATPGSVLRAQVGCPARPRSAILSLS